jgi:ribosomal protein S18 acetylase RimI-like enzyme
MTVRPANFTDAADAAALVHLIDAYSRDPRGGGKALTPDALERMVPDLAGLPTARAWLAFEDDDAVGVCVGFIGYSTFHARPLLNIHDLAVLRGQRGRGIGRALLAAAEEHARATGCCKLTLEVLEDNQPARRLYERCGFRDVRLGDSGPALFLGKLLPVKP